MIIIGNGSSNGSNDHCALIRPTSAAIDFNRKSAIKLNREQMVLKRPFTGLHFWAPGYCVSTNRLDEQFIGDYVKKQELLEQPKLG